MRIKTDDISISTLDVIRLILISCHPFNSAFSVQFDSFKRLISLDDLGHLFFYTFEILRPDRFIQIDVIIKSITNCRTVYELCFGPDTADSFRHNMSAAVTDYFKPPLVFIRRDCQRYFTADWS